MKRIVMLLAVFCWGTAGVAGAAVPEKVSPAVAKAKGCLSCHEGIEDIRDSNSAMMLQIKAIGTGNGDPQGCVVCHGCNPQGLTKKGGS